tara:strand:- start:451 stop:840 length:390 start_codon:yes stop_codon:yes gene_type:complete
MISYFIRENDEVVKVIDQDNGIPALESWATDNTDYELAKLEADTYLAKPLSPEPTGSNATWSVDSCPDGTIIAVWDSLTHEELTTHTTGPSESVPLNFIDVGIYTVRVQSPDPAREVRKRIEVTNADFT